MQYILTNKSLSDSARVLARELGFTVSLRPLEEAPTIRWGNSEGEYGLDDTYYNHPKLIRQSRRDILSGILLSEQIPAIEINPSGTTPEVFPVVCRKNLNGMQGDGITIAKSLDEFELTQCIGWSKWYNFSYELGVHLFDGQIQRVFKKVWDPRVNEEEPDFPIRNVKNGYHFHLCNTENFKRLPNIMDKFYAEIPIGFCRIDIGWDLDNKTYRIIECNSAPSLTNNQETLRLYVNNLHQVIYPD